MTSPRYVYSFGEGQADGSADMKALLGGKGANLAEMTRLGMPVPPGFTLTTAACQRYYDDGRALQEPMRGEVSAALTRLEAQRGRKLGDPVNPLLVSVRSGAAISMPGMMDTVLNLGLNDVSVGGLAEHTGDARFAYDSYRRFIQMYADVVMGVRRDVLEQLLERAKEGEGVYSDSELSVEGLQRLCDIFKNKIVEATGQMFPQEPMDQLWLAIGAVFGSWSNRRAMDYRHAHGIPADLGTAVNVQAMVFGNMDDASATGVAFTRDPKTGARRFFGEWLKNAQGEDVVAGIRTPQPINVASGAYEGDETLEDSMPAIYAELVEAYAALEAHYLDMQDFEFTVEQGKLWMLQTRTGKRSPQAAVRIAVDMVREGLIPKKEAIRRVSTDVLEKLLLPRIDPDASRTVIVYGLGASPGAATGRVVFYADDAVEWAARGERVVLFRPETSPEDIHGMLKAQGIVTARGGMTSHAAVVARGMGKTCIVGCHDLRIDLEQREARSGNFRIGEGDLVTLDGSEGAVILGATPTIEPEATEELTAFMGWIDEFRVLGVRGNADTPRDCRVARGFGAEGIGLCRTEHMFFDEGRIQVVREMILAEDEEGRRSALARILPMQRGDFAEIFRIMHGLPVTIRLLDPPLHEFLPHTRREVEAIAQDLGVQFDLVDARNRALAEINPMLGHRGCRLGLTYPEIYEMQVRAIMEAACDVSREDGARVSPEIMIPLVSHVRELEVLRDVVKTTTERVLAAAGEVDVDLKIGTMIELPRACLTADELARQADFFSFGTNDLTQTTFGISRDDGGKFLPHYVDMGILPIDPFISLDPAVGELVRMATVKGRAANPNLKVGICGEHGGEPRSVAFCHSIRLDYVSCSPFRVPVARLAAAHAALAEEEAA